MKKSFNKEFNKHFLLLFSIATLAISSIAFTHFQQNNAINGAWISKDDDHLKWVFTEGISEELYIYKELEVYYNNELIDTYTYSISTTSPQCGKEVQTGPRLEFLELTNINSGEQKCYYINNLNDSTLSLSPFGRSTILVFEKQ